jgi:hypothetical protein
MIAWKTPIIRVEPIQVIPLNSRFRSWDQDNLIEKKTKKITKPICLKKEKNQCLMMKAYKKMSKTNAGNISIFIPCKK